jgi:septum formation protein
MSVMETKRTSQVAAKTGHAPQTRETLVLASRSPRRAAILRAVGWPFEVEAADVDETLRAGETAARYVERLAREKAEAVAARRLFGLLLGADTTVVVDGEILAKPDDEADARRMLRRLRGRWHEVLTGVALVRAETRQAITAHATTRVRFAPMTDAEIDWYVATGEPMDKAGAYAVQGHAALFIEAIDGDFWNVVGLPVRLVYELSAQL